MSKKILPYFFIISAGSILLAFSIIVFCVNPVFSNNHNNQQARQTAVNQVNNQSVFVTYPNNDLPDPLITTVPKENQKKP